MGLAVASGRGKVVQIVGTYDKVVLALRSGARFLLLPQANLDLLVHRLKTGHAFIRHDEWGDFREQDELRARLQAAGCAVPAIPPRTERVTVVLGEDGKLKLWEGPEEIHLRAGADEGNGGRLRLIPVRDMGEALYLAIDWAKSPGESVSALESRSSSSFSSSSPEASPGAALVPLCRSVQDGAPACAHGLCRLGEITDLAPAGRHRVGALSVAPGTE
jgi:hypothetical protein